MREYIVIVKEGEDLSALDTEMAASSGSGCVPNRAVECTDACEHDTRMTHWNLTDEEAETLKNDERIYDVEIPYKDNPDVEYSIDAVKTNQWFSKSTSTSALYVNWGLHRCSSATDPFNDGTNLGAVLSIKNYHYAVDGTGVDIVIMDSGVKNDHPEFQDAAGNSRVKEIDWYAESGGNMSGTLGASFYTEQGNHGTFCAGISAGKTYGWAKNADIYSIKIFDTDAVSDSTGMDLIRHWHNNKGTGRPTIVNMSYGYGYVTDGAHGAQASDTGSHWNTVTNQFDSWTYGDSGYNSKNDVDYKTDFRADGRPSNRNATADAKLDQLIAAGVHVVISAGNGTDAQFNDTAVANNNYFDYFNRPGFNGNANVYYHKCGSPRTTNNGNDIVVGSIGTISSVYYSGGLEQLSDFTARGPAVDIYAPGHNIISTCAVTEASYNQVDYPADTNFLIGRANGTSFAAPQVTGLGAVYLQVHPTSRPAQLKTAILGDAKTDLLKDNLSTFNSSLDKYRDTNGLWWSWNRYMYNKFHGDMVAKWS